VGSGYTPEGWHTVLRMMANQGVVVPADQLPALTQYVTTTFPERAGPPAW
jgi:virginiamycin B lyase